MKLALLEHRCCEAPDNMADDMLLLESQEEKPQPFFRTYSWSSPCMTFGYTQNWSYALNHAEDLPLTRRPTGGGIVDHRNDLTYTLVLPITHPLAQARASESYRLIHEAIAEALDKIGISTDMIPCEREACGDTDSPTPHTPAPTICFTRPEIFDLCLAGTRNKIAGAAQKRNRHGLLVQGSLDTQLAPKLKEQESAFRNTLVTTLSTALELESEACQWPFFTDVKQKHWRTLFRSAKWQKRR